MSSVGMGFCDHPLVLPDPLELLLLLFCFKRLTSASNFSFWVAATLVAEWLFLFPSSQHAKYSS